MNRPSGNQFDALVFALLDGEIVATDHVMLEEMLRHDPIARRRYLELVDLHDLLEQVTEEGPAAMSQEVRALPDPHLPQRKSRQRLARPLLAAAAVFVLAGVAIKLFWHREAPVSARVLAAPYSSYSIRTPEGVDGSSSNQALRPGDSMELTQGSLELTFTSGAKSILQAPAYFTVASPSRLVLREGRGWFHVPVQAAGFEVTTDQLQIVDLGTRFEVVADRGERLGNDEVHVFEGKTRVQSLHGSKDSSVVTAGEARMAQGNGALRPVPLSAAGFVGTLPTDLPHVRWSFDGGSPWACEGNTPDLADISSVVVGSAPALTEGISGKASRFVPNRGYLRTSWRGVDADRPRTIAGWIRCSRQKPIGSIVEWGIVRWSHPLVTASKWRVTLNPEKFGEGGVQGALRTEFGNGYVIGTTDLRDGRWHHIASVYEGGSPGTPNSIRLYVDGRSEAISAFQANDVRTLIGDADSSPCLIGKQFEGEIDELQIIEGVLPEEVIRERAKPPASR